MVDFKELEAKRAESRAFYATACGKLLNDYRNKLISETVYGEREHVTPFVLQRNDAATRAAEQALIAEIKRLQAIEAQQPTDADEIANAEYQQYLNDKEKDQ